MLYVIVNPATGAGKGDKVFRKVKPVFREAGVKYRVCRSSKEKSIGEIIAGLSEKIKKMPDGEYLDVVIIGGDGSMNEAVNGITDFDRTRIGFIPAGSGNDLAKALGIGKKPKKTARSILKAQTVRLLDIGKAETDGKRYLFNISSGIGFDAATCFFADKSAMKGRLNHVGFGKLIYIAVALRLIFGNRRFKCRITMKNGVRRIYKDCLFVVGMNHKYEGGGFMFCPYASDDDGMLDFCAVDRVSALKFLWMFPTALFGGHIKYPEVEILRAEEMTIATDKPCHIHTDGEAVAFGRELKLSLSDKKLKLLV